MKKNTNDKDGIKKEIIEITIPLDKKTIKSYTGRIIDADGNILYQTRKYKKEREAIKMLQRGCIILNEYRYSNYVARIEYNDNTGQYTVQVKECSEKEYPITRMVCFGTQREAINALLRRIENATLKDVSNDNLSSVVKIKKIDI